MSTSSEGVAHGAKQSQAHQRVITAAPQGTVLKDLVRGSAELLAIQPRIIGEILDDQPHGRAQPFEVVTPLNTRRNLKNTGSHFALGKVPGILAGLVLMPLFNILQIAGELLLLFDKGSTGCGGEEKQNKRRSARLNDEEAEKKRPTADQAAGRKLNYS